MNDLPTGTVTFLFTDVDGSMPRSEGLPAEMTAMESRYESIIHDAVAASGGCVFKTVGEACYAAFAQASHALVAAVTAQRALLTDHALPELRVRMALHTGLAEERDGDYFGPPLNRVARLLATGHGGQVLLSLVTKELVRDDLPAGSILRDMGEHRLKDLSRPERIFQLVAPDLAMSFPALKTLDSRPHNLPVQPTSFVGRERDVAAIQARLATARLVTLTGVGGTGKTRLALQVAAEVLDDYPDGVWFVDLAPIVDAALVAQTLAIALSVAEQPGRSIETTLADHLQAKQSLIVLDNCEHLIEASAALAAELVRSTDSVRLLATSREALGVTGEASYAVSTLSMPEVGAPAATSADLRALAQYEAVRLFIDRAVLMKSDFAVTSANAPAVAGICQQLDGVPLAIELAAARVKHMPPEQILARLDQRFRLLTGGGRDRLPRQQTLAAAIDWSHELLDVAEQAIFRRLSVFRGGWTLEAAERVCGGGPVEDWEVVDLLLRLVDKSLVVAGELGGEERYRFLETVREYAQEKRIVAGERESFQDRHLVHVVEMVAALGEANAAVGAGDGQDPERLMARARADNENIRAAVDWACDSANAAAAAQLGAGLWWFWVMTGQLSEGRRRLSRVLEMRDDGERRLRGFARYGLGVLAAIQQNDDIAERVVREALEEFQACGERMGESWCLNDLGNLALNRRDLNTAELFYESSLAIKRNVASISDQAGGIINLGCLAEERNDWPVALERYQEVITMLGHTPPQSNTREFLQRLCFRIGALGNGGDVLLELGRLADATASYRKSLELCAAHDVRFVIPESVARFAWLAAAQAQWMHAAHLLGACDQLYVEIEATFTTKINQHRHTSAIAAARAALGDAAFDAAYAAGRAMSVDEAVAYALGDSDE